MNEQVDIDLNALEKMNSLLSEDSILVKDSKIINPLKSISASLQSYYEHCSLLPKEG